MHKFFTETNNITETEGKIVGDDVKHIYKVLRLSKGEKVVLITVKERIFRRNKVYR